MPHARAATIADVLSLAPRLRDVDKEECRAVYGETPVGNALLLCMLNAEKCWAVVNDDNSRCIAMFGLSPMLPNVGCPWFVSSEEMFKYPKVFLKECSRYVEEMQSPYPVLTNFVSVKNAKAMRWLRWCGFTIDTANLIPEFGFDKQPYYPFYRNRT